MKRRRRTIRPLEQLPSLFAEEELTDAESFGQTSPPQKIVRNAGLSSDDDIDALPDEFRSPRHRLRFISFGSGSSGNCSYIGTPHSGLLVDAGVDNKFVMAELARNGISPDTIHGILLTHDHGDHVRYVYALVRRNPSWRIFATPRTIEGILRRHNISRRISDYHSPIFKEHEYLFDDIKVIPFETSHDGADNVGFCFRMGSTSFVIATDTGYITPRADFYLRTATAIMIEANYDLDMLINGKYREHLKARIRSDIGHMDNTDTAAYIAKIYRPELSHVLLCHLSLDNNSPEIAMATVSAALHSIGIGHASSSANILPGTVFLAPLPRYRSSELFVL